MIKTSKLNLINTLKQFNLPKNHIYLIHSSVLKFGLFEDGLNGMMMCLQEVLGPEATILMPTFTFSFGQTRKWDYENSKSETGALTEYFRKSEGAHRTQHPFHSLAVAGARRDWFTGSTNLSSFGPGSPFAKLYDAEAFNIALGIGLVGGATFLHHAEEEACVPYRFHKDFPGQVIGKEGKIIDQTYKMFVREIGQDYQYVNEWGHVLSDLSGMGLVQEKKINGAEILVFNIKKNHDYIKHQLDKNPFYMAKKIIT